MGSLFNQTVAEVNRIGAELAAANKRIQDLERALKNSRAVNAQMLKKLYGSTMPDSTITDRKYASGINSLSGEEVDELFSSARMAETADAGDLKSPDPGHAGSIPALGTKFKKMVAALLTRSRAVGKNAEADGRG